MPLADRTEPRHVPPGLAGADGFPWSRLIMGLIAVAISATTTWRAGRPPVEPANESPPPPRLTQRDAAGLALPLRQPEAVPAEALPAPTPDISFELAAHQRRVAHVTTTSAGHMRRHKSRTSAVVYASRVAPPRLSRSRAEVRNEYIASREEVAALTGEDSGSAYLSRRAAQQSAATHATPAHGRRREPATNRS